MIVEILSYATAILLIIGALFGLFAAIGILRLPDLYTRMHAASKAGAVGAGLIFAAVAVVSLDLPIALRAIIGIAFVVLTAPVSAHLLARAALKAGYQPSTLTAVNDLDAEGKSQP